MQIESGAVSPGGSIDAGWKLIKDDYWTFFGMCLVAIVIVFVAALILGGISNVVVYAITAVLGVATSTAGDTAKMSAAVIPSVIELFIGFFTNIISATIIGALFAGIYKALSRKSMGAAADFGDLFAGFKNIQSCLIVAVAVSAAQLVINAVVLVIGLALGVSAVGMGMLSGSTPPSGAMIGGIVGTVLGLFAIMLIGNVIISVLTMFSYPLIGERELSGGESLKLSAKGGLANFGGIILLMILLGLMSLAGVLLCFVGVLFVIPVYLASLFSAYQSVFGRPQIIQENFAPPPPPTFGNQQQYWG